MEMTLSQVADLVNGHVEGNPDQSIYGIASVDEVDQTQMTFVFDQKYLSTLEEKKAGGVLIEAKLFDEVKNRFPELLHYNFIVTEGVRIALIKILKGCEEDDIFPTEGEDQDLTQGEKVRVFPGVSLGKGVHLGNSVTIYPGCVIGDGVRIGDHSVLFPNVVLYGGTIIGKNVRIHGGTVIGSDGFGYVQVDGKNVKVPQIGIVEIEDDVEIGANATIDRATVSRTLIKRGTKIDNQVQIAHNVVIGEDGILCSQVGIAGSTQVGDRVMMGGKAGVVDNRTIGDNVMISPMTGVIKNISSGQYVSGFIARPHKEYLYHQALISRLPRLIEEVADLKSKTE